MSLSSLLLPLLLVVAGDAVKSGDAPPPPPPPPPPESPYGDSDDLRGGLCQHPSLQPLIELAKRLPPRENPRVDVVLVLDYRADGTVTGVTVQKSSDIPELDGMLVEWTRQARLCPRAEAGKGRIPFSIWIE